MLDPSILSKILINARDVYHVDCLKFSLSGTPGSQRLYRENYGVFRLGYGEVRERRESRQAPRPSYRSILRRNL